MVAEDEDGEFEACVQGLSFNAYDSDVRDLFESCENIINVKLLTKPDGGSKGTAFVKFSKKSSFNKALGLNETEHMGRTIKVSEAMKKSENFNGNAGNGRPERRNNNYGAPV